MQAWQASDQSKPVVDLSYCYITGITAGSDCTAVKSANDTDKIQWVKDNVTQQTTTYTYDSNSRLTKAAQAGGVKNVTWAYTYDVAGNRLTATETGDVTSSQTLTYNAVGQITTTGYAYDKVGNLTASPSATFTYNGAQQLTSSTKDGVKTSYEYAGADMNKLLHQATDGGSAYDYTYGKTLTAPSVSGTGTASVISDPTTGQPLDLQTTDGTTSMWILDGTGSPAAAIADTGKTAYKVSYDPYGVESISSDGAASAQWQQNPYGFKAGLRSSDDNGMTKFGYRWQTNGTGGWIERDTLDVPLDPSNANRYAYAGDDPINSSDPTGRLSDETQSEILDGIGFGLGLASVAVTATGVGAPVGLALGLAAGSTAASVGARAVVGDTSGAVGAGLLGAATLGLGGLGEALEVPTLAKTATAAGYTGIELGTSYLSN